MDIIDDMRQQRAVYWPPGGGLDDDGSRIANQPRELRVRWEDSTEIVRGPDGRDRAIKSKVYVGEDLEIGGILRRGKLSAIPRDQLRKPFNLPDAYEIFRFDKTPATIDEEPIEDNDWLRIAYL